MNNSIITKIISQCSKYKQWIVIAFSLVIILFLFQKTLNPLIDQRNKILSETFLVNELQYAILKSLSHDSFKSTTSFDTLNNQVRLLKETLKSLKNNHAIQQDPILKTELTHLIDRVRQQRILIEQIKTDTSVLQNSLHFFPSSYEACTQSIQHTALQTPVLENLLKNTLITGLMMTQNAYLDRIALLKKQLIQLEAYPELPASCQTFIDHNRILLQYLPKVQQHHNQFSSLKVDQKIHQFYIKLEQITSQRIAKNQYYYSIILIFTIFLLVYIGITLTSLSRSNSNLKQTLQELSKQQALFEALVKANSAITQSNDKNTLYQKICDIATQESLFESCWIGEVQANQTLASVAYAGEGKDIFKHLVISLDPDASEHYGSILQSYLQKKPILSNHYQQKTLNTPWAEMIQTFGIQGNAALPIIVDDAVIAILAVYTRKSGFFNAENNEFLYQLVHDISIILERFASIQKQEKQQQDLAISAIAFESHEAIVITDSSANIIRCNQAFSQLTGYSPEEVIGKSPNILKSNLHTKVFYQELWQQIFKTGSWQGEIWNLKKDGTLYPCWQSISAVVDSKGKVTHYISHALDLTKDKESQRQIKHLSYHDQLTNLPNRSLLLDRLSQALRKNHSIYNALILINLNRFKLFNDSLGHSAGDELLIKVAKRLQNMHIKDVKNFSIARVGSDEFAVSCLLKTEQSNKACKKAKNIAHTIQTNLAESFTIQGQMAIIDTSLGVTLFTPCHKTPEELLQEANTALDRAKKIAKQTAQSSIQFYEPNMQKKVQDRLALENQLRTALTNIEFTLQYQPQIELTTGKIIGIESLIRWQKPDGTLIPPNDFIPALEESGLIIPVGLWIIETAIEQAISLHKIQPNLTLSVNLSAIQFNDKDLINKVTKLLNTTQYPAHLLEFEVTESLLMSDIEETIKKLNAFADLGIKIAIDDFGTGYSSLAYLKRFPVSKLKIDKTFIDDITHTESSDAAIVQASIQMAKALKITTIAEGVEEQAQLDLLKHMGCNEIQGYFFSRPLPPLELQQFIQQKKNL